MNILFLGAPGSGKGTQGERLATQHAFTLLTASQLLRDTLQSGNALSAQIQADMDAGKLVSDDMVWQVMSVSLRDCQAQQQSCILDGYPRSLGQLAFLQQSDYRYDYLVHFTVSDAVVTQRICGRRVHLPSGRVYHVDFAPPKTPGLDDITGEPLVHRADDQLEVVQARLATYKEKTLPILEAVQTAIDAGQSQIQSMITIDADQPIDVVTHVLQQQLGLQAS